MNILMYKWDAYNHVDVEGNLMMRGHQINVIEETLLNVEYQPSFEKKLREALSAHTYDLVFSINFFPLISDICEEFGIQYVFWTCDSQITCMYHQSIFNSCNACFVFDQMDYLTFKEMGVNVHYLPLAAAVERIQHVLATESDLANFKSEVSFIGSMYDKNLYDTARPHLSEYLRGYFDCALQIQQDLYTKTIFSDILTPDVIFELQKILTKQPSSRSLSTVPQVFSTSVLGFKAAQLERKQRLCELSRLCALDVYTDDEKADFLFAKNKGQVSYWQDAPKIFHESKINLNLTIKNIRAGIPLRIFDILASQGFLITNFQPELPLYFKNEQDLVWFTSPEELEEKVVFYLKHDTLRQKIATHGFEKIKEQHTYQHRFDEMAKAVPGL